MNICSNCYKVFKKKYNYERHIMRKTSCKIETVLEFDNTLLAKMTKFECEKCYSTFSTQGNLDRHIKNPPSTCQVIRTVEENLKELNKKIDDISPNIIPVINQQINNQQIINFAKPGEEKIDHITKDMILQIMKADNFQDVCKELMKQMYFNNEVPENSGWCIIYPKNENAAMVLDHDSGTFKRENTKKIIDEKFTNMMDKISHLINEIYNDPETREKLSTNQRRNIFQLYNHFGMTHISRDSPMVYKEIHSLAYNIRQIPMDSWKKEGLNAKHLSIKF